MRGLNWLRQLFVKSKYHQVGGAPVIDQLVKDFYEIMYTDPAAKDCLATHHGRERSDSQEKLFAFLSGWLGGPQLYLQKFGHPRLRMRHFPFTIGEKESQQWLYCMDKALRQSKIKESLQVELMQAFEQMANLVKNQ